MPLSADLFMRLALRPASANGAQLAPAATAPWAAPAPASDGSPTGAPRLLFVVNNDWFFLSHRLPLALAARDAGMAVTVAARDNGFAEAIRREGLSFVPLPISRKGIGPLGEMRTLVFLARLYRRLRPHLVHHVTIRPVLYGSMAARLCREVSVVNAISGLGYVFSEEGRAGVLRRVVEAMYRVALSHRRSCTIFQNPEDRDEFVRRRLLDPRQSVLIRGSGVDCARFVSTPEPAGVPVVLLPARLLWDKGVGTFVEAARLLRAQGVRARFVLVGEPDEGNPTAVPLEELHRWTDEGIVEWWGYRDDMPAVMAQAAIVTLPTKREGLPKVLLEAGAAGRVVVATDVPGCREVVVPGVNGLLVPPDDPPALAEALAQLLADRKLRRRYGMAARRLVEAEFTQEFVAEQTLDLYSRLLRRNG